MIYRCKHFIIQELVGPETFKARGDQAWSLLDPGMLMTLDAYRNKFGSIVINNWHAGGSFKESGLRDFTTATGAQWSMHKFGRAFDSKPQKVTVKEMYDYVLAHPDEFPYVNRVENIAATPTWFHSDSGNSPTRIVVVNP